MEQNYLLGEQTDIQAGPFSFKLVFFLNFSFTASNYALSRIFIQPS
jgi:hypothetical protein